jgi:alkane 1-monooxygenase
MAYLFSLIVPLLSLTSLTSHEFYFILLPVIYTFILIPLMDLLPFNPSMKPLKEIQLRSILWAVCFLYLMTFIYFLTKIPVMGTDELILKSLMMGISGGVIGINCAHELGHHNSKFDVTFAKVLLLTTSYMHFYIEHNRGHHKNVSTPEDPATSRINETVYAFILRSVVMSWSSAFRIEKKKNGIMKNKVIHYAIYQLLFNFLLAIWNERILLGFVLHSLVSIILLEAVNYIEHYGIVRFKRDGRYEKVTAIHSWNSDHFFSRIHLFELSRHSDHHALASKPFYELESLEQSPQMPTGYAGMVLMAFVPPLWFRIMNPKVRALQNV